MNTSPLDAMYATRNELEAEFERGKKFGVMCSVLALAMATLLVGTLAFRIGYTAGYADRDSEVQRAEP